MIIKITQEHIDKGYWTDPLHSPITLALKEAGFKSVLTFRDNVYIDGHKIPYSDHPHLPCVQPFEFEFNARLPLFQRLKAALSEAISYTRLT